MLSQLFGTLMTAAENGVMPDAICRSGIRKLLRERLNSLNTESVEQQNETFRAFLSNCRSSPIAVATELANEQHYEVPAEFFSTVLGSRLKYSCCEWPQGTYSLDEAEESALKTTCTRANLSDGMQILELGCGWGSLSLWMAKHYPNSQILAVSNSNSQRTFIENKAQQSGFGNLTVVTSDMNDFSTQRTFDRVVSVEMFEHMRNHEELLRRISGWLKPAGQLFVHVFCHKQHAYLFEPASEQDWMARHFFSGGMMPSENLLPRYHRDLNLVDQWRWDGRHYEQTCNEWLKRQDAATDELQTLFSKTYGEENANLWLNRWRIFFMACAELFGYQNGSEWWVAHYLFEKPSR